MKQQIWKEHEMTIRMATPEDAEALLEIYEPYVINTAITFEYEVPTVEEFSDRIRKVLEKFPYLVMEDEQQIIGFAYVSPFKGRAAYDWSVETSIYVRQDQKRKKVGTILYEKLEALLKMQGILNVNACIAYPVVENEHLNLDSVRFHEKLGYEIVGRFHQCGYKFQEWYDMVWMEKIIGEHLCEQPPVKNIDLI